MVDSNPDRPGHRLARRLALPLATVAAVAVLQAVVGLQPAAAAAQADTEAPSTPGSIVIADISTTQVRLTWQGSTDNIGVDRYEVSQAFTDVVMLHSTATNGITISGLRPSGTYTFSVRARDAAGNSSLSSAPLRVTTPPGDNQPPTVPGRPTVSAVTDTTATLTWAASSDNVYVALYEVLRISGAGNTVVAYAPQHPPTGPTTRVTGLSPGTTYAFAVRARDDAGNYSATSAPMTVTTTGGPAAATCTVFYRITAEWQGGFYAEVTVRNSGSAAIDGWTLGWTFPAGQGFQHLWGAVLVAQNGASVSVRNETWNGQLPAGGTADFGFLGTGPGGNPVPTAFTLNGVACATTLV